MLSTRQVLAPSSGHELMPKTDLALTLHYKMLCTNPVPMPSSSPELPLKSGQPPGKHHHNSCTTRSPCPVPVWCLYHAPTTKTQRELSTVLSQPQSWRNGFCSPSRGSSTVRDVVMVLPCFLINAYGTVLEFFFLELNVLSLKLIFCCISSVDLYQVFLVQWSFLSFVLKLCNVKLCVYIV